MWWSGRLTNWSANGFLSRAQWIIVGFPLDESTRGACFGRRCLSIGHARRRGTHGVETGRCDLAVGEVAVASAQMVLPRCS